MWLQAEKNDRNIASVSFIFHLVGVKFSNILGGRKLREGIIHYTEVMLCLVYMTNSLATWEAKREQKNARSINI